MVSDWLRRFINVRRASVSRSVRFAALIGVLMVAVTVGLGGSAAGTVARRLPPRRPTAATAATAGTARRAPTRSLTRQRQQAQTRYSLVNGCYALHSPSGAPIAAADGPFRMQAAALGVYLLYGPSGDYLIDAGGGTLQNAAAPSTGAEWSVAGDSVHGFTMTNAASGTRLPVGFTATSGCSTYPEAGVDASGTSFAGASPESDVLGTVEGHAHVTAFELFGGDWHCGRPWSPFGAPSALPASCAADEQGTNGEVESLLDFGGPTRPSDMHGWPTFVQWPSPTALAEEGDYYTGIERAWKAGLRLMVTNLVDNEALCSLMSTQTNPCNDMASVHIQSGDLYALQDYIDAQSGGPGKGWFRVVTDPIQARRVINEGKLAVIEGIEVSRIFGCGEYDGVAQCDPAQVDAGLKEVYKLGVRTFFPVHEFDNAFGGTKMISGDIGALINAGNREETGSFWTLQSCPAEDQDAEQVTIPATGPIAQLGNGPLASLLGGSLLPVYGSGPQCNTRGLTGLGAYLVGQMIKDHFIMQLDHMDSKTATAALSIAQAAHYSGVVSAHCCSSPQLFRGVYSTGGLITAPVAPAAAFVATVKADQALSDPRYHFGFGYGSDMNGLADQPGPSSGTPITYPFKSYLGNVTFGREQWGQRTFDLNTDGLANYGMYADWLRDVQVVGGPSVMADMFQGAEGYLEMWERADGVPTMSCLPARGTLTSAGLGQKLHLGDSVGTALYRGGQPLSRPGRTYRYCLRGATGGHTAIVSVFNARGRVAMVASTASGDHAGGLAPGAPVRRLRAAAHQLMSGVWVGRPLRGGARYVYGVRGGRVRFVAVGTFSGRRQKATLRSYLQAAAL
jgi:hypothetical protein